MYKEHPVFKKPKNKNVKIWRYMDFTKFVNLLDTSTLFFTSAHRLDDPFEGSYPKENVSQRERAYKAMVKNLPETLQDDFKKIPLHTANAYKQLTKLTFINSWHENEYESAAMWKLYVKNNEGIAIQSTFIRLMNCFTNGTPDINIGEIQYIDYERETLPVGNVFYPFLHKRKSFEHERELRAVIQHWNLIGTLVSGKASNSNSIPEYGITVSVDLNRLIGKIYLAPTAPKWLFELTKSVTKKYGLNKKVHQSSLDDVPVY